MANETRSEEVKQCVELLTELEDTINQAKASLLDRTMKMVNANAMLDKLYTIKKLLPESVAKAIQIVNDADGIRSSAMDEAKATRETSRRDNETFQADLTKRRQQADVELANTKQQAAQIVQQTQHQINQMMQQAQAQANQMLQQAEAQANQTAQQIISQAKLEADQMKSREQVYQQAQQDAERIRAESQAEATQLRRQTFEYLEGMVGQLENYVGAMLTDVHQEHQSIISHRG